MSSDKSDNMFWPDVSTIEKAEGVAKGSAGIPLFVGCMTVLVVLYGYFFSPILGITLWALIDASIFGLIAYGMFRINRVVSVIGLAFYIWSQVDMLTTQGAGFGVLAVFFMIYWVNGIRGAFKYHKLKKQASSIEQATT
ncbi:MULTISPECIES: hypothetical protein [unclassified Colwellia]|uniref:hypothetical protein n=1 Tax=unclassified Colwellia TaxID=196834 RepID=UPI0015F58E3B|nr:MULTISPECIES: hypothetical protein [unclassified Colwellia]MBA6231866.1 hypothetical protein [Colwellia sp. MB02u-7]MBA6235630.1 hypothetical protein [Colwellia sp. MB02u-11]MBA6297971.1 hypothetical protein [Colwellia sp. MB3u-22]MBA6310368.1 hypothetical protein [Colwellia sp. MB3u-64]